MTRWVRCLAAAVLASSLLTGCGVSTAVAPRCTALERLGLVAQSVPSSTYIPCVTTLPPGWQSSGFTVRNGQTRFDLLSDRAQGRVVAVALRAGCSVGASTPIPPRTPGGRTYVRLTSITPRYAGTLYDVFPGGCVTYRFDFRRGPHIELMAQLQASVGLVARAQLRLALRRELGIDLGDGGG